MFPRVLLQRLGLLSFVLGTVMIAGCGFSQAQPAVSTAKTDTLIKVKTAMTDNDELKAVPISATKFDGDKISFGVISFGCTTTEDFSVEHKVVNGLCEVKINRINRDMCRRAPFVAEIEIEWSQPDECKNLSLVIANPLLITNGDNTIRKRMK